MVNKKDPQDKKSCNHLKWLVNGNGQYICNKCGKTTTMSARKMYKILKNIVDLIQGENSQFILQHYIDNSDGVTEFYHAPFCRIVPKKITWDEFNNTKKQLKSSTNSVLIFSLDEHRAEAEAELVIYEVMPNV